MAARIICGAQNIPLAKELDYTRIRWIPLSPFFSDQVTIDSQFAVQDATVDDPHVAKGYMTHQVTACNKL